MIDSLYYARGQIWNRKNDRAEEGRSVLKKCRPVIIVSNNIGNFYSGVVTVVPLTTSERTNEIDTQVKVNVNGRQSWALCEQMYCTSKDCLGSYIGTIGYAKMKEIDDAIKFSVAPDVEIEERARALEEEVCSADAEEVNDIIKEVTDTKLEPTVEKPAVCVESKKCKRTRTRYTDESKLELLISVEDNLKSSAEGKKQLANSLGFSNWNSLMATARRFRREIESE